MHNGDVFVLVQRVLAGDNASVQKLLNLFAQQQINHEQAEEILFLLKAQNHHQAIYFVGLLYKHGFGLRQDYDLSYLTMREAASKGNAKATYEVGHHFLLGLGVDKNYASALQWLKRAASSPYYIPEAMYDIGIMYEQGLGLEPNDTVAQDWFHKAADRGHLEAQNKIK